MTARTLSSLLFLLLLAAAAFTPSTSTDTIYRNTTLTGNQTLVSAGGVYALGFFTPDGAADGRTYLGIWYASIPGPTTVVWVANRQDPVLTSAASLHLTAGGCLAILDGNNVTVWSSAAPTAGSNITARAAAQLLDTGNLVLRADSSSSDSENSVDTRHGITRNITSWRNPTDPSPGDVTRKYFADGDYLFSRG